MFGHIIGAVEWQVEYLVHFVTPHALMLLLLLLLLQYTCPACHVLHFLASSTIWRVGEAHLQPEACSGANQGEQGGAAEPRAAQHAGGAHALSDSSLPLHEAAGGSSSSSSGASGADSSTGNVALRWTLFST
jgi:hypothetical protein